MASEGKSMILHRLARDKRGISSIEFVIVASVFFMLIFGMVDFSRAMWEWNAAAKATHWGVRYAVVNDMVSIRMAEFSGVLAGVDAGEAVDPDESTHPHAGVVVANLGTDIFTCTNTGCNGNADPDSDFDVDAFALIVARMQAIYDKIQPENVIVEYHHIGLGFAGDPLGPAQTNFGCLVGIAVNARVVELLVD